MFNKIITDQFVSAPLYFFLSFLVFPRPNTDDFNQFNISHENTSQSTKSVSLLFNPEQQCEKY